MRLRRLLASRVLWPAAAPLSSSTAGASRSLSAFTWTRARAAGWAGPPPPNRPVSREHWCSGAPGALAAGSALLLQRPPPWARAGPALSLLKLQSSPGGVASLPASRDPVSSGDPSLGGLGCSCHKPLSRPHVTLCSSLLPQARVTSCPSIPGPMPLGAPLCPQGLCHLVPPLYCPRTLTC